MEKQTKSTRKKILFVTRPLSPPWDEASKNFAYDLTKNMHDNTVTILTSEPDDNLPNNIHTEMIHMKSHGDFTTGEKIRSLLFQMVKRNDFDIYHFIFTPTKLNAFVIKHFIKNKKLKTVQTVATLREDLYSDEELKKLMYGDIIVTYSKYAQTKLKSLGIKNITQIYPGFDLSNFMPTDKSMSLMKKWNFTKNDFVVTYPGEFTRLGATDLIIDTFLKLWNNPANAHIKYLCACRIKNNSDTKRKQEIIKKITAAGHIDKVHFTDTFSDMNAVYNMSDVVIFPVANMKGKFDVPLAMIEPYACKKPVIASNIELFKEFSGDDINVIIPKSDKNALANAILELEKDEAKRKELGENAFEFAHKTFNIEKIAQEYEKIYNEL
ncbi:MAG: glycosyltransferase family 4 protein [Patescibacteria group bacterium]